MQLRRKQDSLGFKLGLSFGIVGLILIGALLITILEVMKVNHSTQSIANSNTPIAKYGFKIVRGLDNSIDLQHQIVQNKSKELAQELELVWSQEINPANASINTIITQSKTISPAQQLNELTIQLQNIQTAQENLVAKAIAKETIDLSKEISGILKMVGSADLALEQLLTIQQNNMLYGIADVQKRISTLLIMDWSFLGVGILLCVLLVVVLTKSITKPIFRLVEITKEIAKGRLNQDTRVTGTLEFEELSNALGDMVHTFQDLSKVTGNMAVGDYTHRVNVKSEEDNLAITVNQMLDNFVRIVRQANSIAEGDYSSDIAPRSQKDILGTALQNMTVTLRENKIHTEDEAWLKDGLTKFAAEVSGLHELPVLCNKAISTLSRYTDAGVGTIYLFDQENEKLKLFGSYAYRERDTVNNVYEVGEGVIGQVALERKPILLKNISHNDKVISTGTTETPPLQIYALPIIHEEFLLAVIEVASSTEYTGV